MAVSFVTLQVPNGSGGAFIEGMDRAPFVAEFCTRDDVLQMSKQRRELLIGRRWWDINAEEMCRAYALAALLLDAPNAIEELRHTYPKATVVYVEDDGERLGIVLGTRPKHRHPEIFAWTEEGRFLGNFESLESAVAEVEAAMPAAATMVVISKGGDSESEQ